jgi:hypothetical protein
MAVGLALIWPVSEPDPLHPGDAYIAGADPNAADRIDP